MKIVGGFGGWWSHGVPDQAARGLTLILSCPPLMKWFTDSLLFTWRGLTLCSRLQSAGEISFHPSDWSRFQKEMRETEEESGHVRRKGAERMRVWGLWGDSLGGLLMSHTQKKRGKGKPTQWGPNNVNNHTTRNGGWQKELHSGRLRRSQSRKTHGSSPPPSYGGGVVTPEHKGSTSKDELSYKYVPRTSCLDPGMEKLVLTKGSSFEESHGTVPICYLYFLVKRLSQCHTESWLNGARPSEWLVELFDHGEEKNKKREKMGKLCCQDTAKMERSNSSRQLFVRPSGNGILIHFPVWSGLRLGSCPCRQSQQESYLLNTRLMSRPIGGTLSEMARWPPRTKQPWGARTVKGSPGSHVLLLRLHLLLLLPSLITPPMTKGPLLPYPTQIKAVNIVDDIPIPYSFGLVWEHPVWGLMKRTLLPPAGLDLRSTGAVN